MTSPLSYLKEVIAESRQITWPTRATLIQLSVVVISISFFIALLLGGFDYLATNGIARITEVTAPKTAVPTLSLESPTPAPISPTPTLKPVKKLKK